MVVHGSPLITLCLGSIGMDHVINVSCYKGTMFQRNYRKMTIYGHFPISPSKNTVVKKFGSNKMTMLYPIHVIQ